MSIASATLLTEKIGEIFSEVEDPRVERTRVHLLTDILIIAILSVIAGGKGWEDMENYGESKYEWLCQFLVLPYGIPSADTFRRIFERINPKIFERCFRCWVESIVEKTGAQVIPIDGKTIKGSYDRVLGKTALHLVSAWSSQHRLVLGQVKVADKSNEITAIPALLELNEEQNIKLAQVKEVSPNLKLMHELKEKIRTIFNKTDNWLTGLFKLGIWLLRAKEHFPVSQKTIIRWLDEIVAYFDNGTTSGVVEGINNKLKLIKRSGYGFRNFDNFRVRCLLHWNFSC